MAIQSAGRLPGDTKTRPIGLRMYPARHLLVPYDIETGEELAGVIGVSAEQHIEDATRLTVEFLLEGMDAIEVMDDG